MAKQGEWMRKDQEKAAERGPGAEVGAAHGANKPSSVEGKDKLRGPEDMDNPGAGPRQRTD